MPIISNVTALPQTDPKTLRKNLTDQVTETVRWRETMELAKSLGVKITELGSGKVLLNRKEDDEMFQQKL